MRTVSLMGSTGSGWYPGARRRISAEPERFRVHAPGRSRRLPSRSCWPAAAFGPALVVIGDPARYAEVRDGVPAGTEVMVGEEGMVAAAQASDVVLNAVVGFAGLPVTMAALEAGKRLALANKESLMAPRACRAKGAPRAWRRNRPVDTERWPAVHQCLALQARQYRGRGPTAAHGIGWSFPRLHGRTARCRDGGRRAGASDVVDGAEDHHRLLHAHEQGPRGD